MASVSVPMAAPTDETLAGVPNRNSWVRRVLTPDEAVEIDYFRNAADVSVSTDRNPPRTRRVVFPRSSRGFPRRSSLLLSRLRPLAGASGERLARPGCGLVLRRLCDRPTRAGLISKGIVAVINSARLLSAQTDHLLRRSGVIARRRKRSSGAADCGSSFHAKAAARFAIRSTSKRKPGEPGAHLETRAAATPTRALGSG